MGELKNSSNILVVKRQGKKHLGHIGAGRWIILKWIFLRNSVGGRIQSSAAIAQVKLSFVTAMNFGFPLQMTIS
jgi:hypothetical protein